MIALTTAHCLCRVCCSFSTRSERNFGGYENCTCRSPSSSRKPHDEARVVERQILQLQKQSEKLQTDVNKCKAAGDKANSDVDNGGKSAIVVDLRRQVDGLSAKLSDVVDKLPNKVDLATLVQETTSSRTQQVISSCHA